MFKILAQKRKTCSRINRNKERFLFLFHCCSLLYFKEQDEQAGVILLQRLISRRIQRRRRAAFSQFLTIFAWRQQQRPKRVAWVLPRPQYWFETLFHSNALNMWWKENFRVSRETYWSCIPATRCDITSSGKIFNRSHVLKRFQN